MNPPPDPSTNLPVATPPGYGSGFADGLRAAVDLCRAGATGDQLADLLDADPADADRDAYQTYLGHLRKILHTDMLIEVSHD